MIKKGLKLAGIIGAAFMMLASFAAEVRAESSEQADQGYITKINPVLRVQDWDDRAVATNVEEFASIRKEKSTESTRVGILPKGAYVEVIEYGKEWTLVESGKIKGYVLTKYLAFADNAKEVYNDVHGVKGIIKNKNSKVMDHPFSQANVIAKKAKNVEVKILARIGNWYRIQLDKKTTAYMNVEDVKITDSVAMTVEAYKEMTAPKETEKKPASNNTSNKGSGVSASKSELDMLAAIIQCEAEGESYKGKVAVGAVVLNRVKSNKFPNTIEGVIKEKGQFSPVASGRFARVLSKGANEECYKAAKDALNGSNPIGKCLFFNTGYGKGFRLGGHQFY